MKKNYGAALSAVSGWMPIQGETHMGKKRLIASSYIQIKWCVSVNKLRKNSIPIELNFGLEMVLKTGSNIYVFHEIPLLFPIASILEHLKIIELTDCEISL